MLREAAIKAAGRPIEFLEADAQSLPFAEGSFDAVVCLFGLMFLPDKKAALESFRRRVRPKGTVVVTCWDRPTRAPFAGLVAEALSVQLPEHREDLLRPFSLSNPQANVALFKAAGFAQVSITLETHVSHFTSFAGDFWEPIEAGGGRLGQAYVGLPAEAREAVRRKVLELLPVRALVEPFSLEHSAWIVVASC
jgi:SAM-dependent methyltransferase